MTGIAGGGGGGSGGYTYVQNPEPTQPDEGETWYDVGSNKAFVFTGTEWVELTVVAHGSLSGIDASDHHTRYSDAEASNAAPVQSVNGETGIVDVAHDELSGVSPDDHHTRPTGTRTTGVRTPNGWLEVFSSQFNYTEGTRTFGNLAHYAAGVQVESNRQGDYVVSFEDGSSVSGSVNNNSKSHTFNSPKWIDWFRYTEQATNGQTVHLRIKPAYVGPHSHGI